MMLKKYIFFLMFIFAVNTAFGQGGDAVITLTPSSQTVYLNQPASVTVGIEGVENLFAVSITLSFNNSIIKCLDITQGDFLINNQGGYVVYFETFPEDLYSASSVTVDQSILGLAAVSGTGDLFTIAFEPFAGGSSAIQVTSFSLRDINNQEIPATFETAEIEVIPTVAAVITLTPSTQTVLSNTPMSVDVGVEGVVGLFAISVTLSFENTIIKCLNITQGNFLASNGGGYNVFFETFPEDLYSASTVTVDQSILGPASVTGTGNIFTISFEPFAGDTSKIEVTSFSLRDINNQEIPTIAETAEIIVNATVVNSKIFLQGPFNSGVMQTTLNISGLLPLTQPYSGTPWNYSGTESVAASFFSTHTDIVDWVLVELRTGISAGTTVARQAAFIKSDGSVVDINGLGPVRFFGMPAAGYYVVVKHRNHLAVMSSNLVSISGITPMYDFTDSQTKAYGTNSMFNLGEVYGMYSADANGNGQVQNNDSEEYWAPQNGLPGYRGPDFNLNGQVQNNDRENYWMPNNGKGTQVPN